MQVDYNKVNQEWCKMLGTFVFPAAQSECKTWAQVSTQGSSYETNGIDVSCHEGMVGSVKTCLNAAIGLFAGPQTDSSAREIVIGASQNKKTYYK